MKLSRALRLTPGDVLALTGGGGKTATMFRLATELSNGSPERWRVLTTTSTRIFAVQIKRSPAHVTFDPAQQTVADILPSLERAIDRYGQVLLIGQAEPKSGKAFGVPPEAINDLAVTGRFDLIINEADGSRMRPFKGPAAHEPVIPTCTTVVTPVVGLDVLGQPLCDEVVHRADLVSQLSGTALGQPVTVETVARLFCHSQGGLKEVPAAARGVPLLNKAETTDDLLAGRDLAEKLLACDRFEAVAIGAVELAGDPVIEVQGRTAAIILAAGGSTRFGSAKQVARWQGQTFIERAVEVALASPARPVIVVLGAEIEQSQLLLKNKPVKIIVNKEWASGQSSSMRAGLAALPPYVSSAIFLLVDQPRLQSTSIEAVIQKYRETMAPVVWPEFQGQRGNPVLFDRAVFAALQHVSGDSGGRPVLEAYRNQAERVSVQDPGIILDIDRIEDLGK